MLAVDALEGYRTTLANGAYVSKDSTRNRGVLCVNFRENASSIWPRLEVLGQPCQQAPCDAFYCRRTYRIRYWRLI